MREPWPPARWLALEPETSLSGRPLATLSLALTHAVAGLDVRAHHANNLALHILNAVLLLFLLRVHLSPGGALAAALLWAVHPLVTDAVSYLTQRTELLMASFYLGTLLAVTRERRGVSVLCCALGMACKESMVTAPVAVLLWERVYRYPSFRALFAQQGRFYTALAATWLVLGALLLLGARAHSAGFAVDASPLDYARSQLPVIAHYLWLVLWPHPLALYYGPLAEVPAHELALGALGVGAALAGALALFWRQPRAGYAALLFFLLLAPTSSVVPIATEVGAERRMYLPLAALVALAVGAAAALVPARPVVRLAAVATLALALGTGTIARNADYASAVRLWQTAVEARPELPQARVNLGIALAEAGRYVEAIDAYQSALALAPEDARAHFGVGSARAALGNLDGARASVERAVALEPRLQVAQLGLARLHVARGDRAAAIATLRAALRASPDAEPLQLELARLLHAQHATSGDLTR